MIDKSDNRRWAYHLLSIEGYRVTHELN